MNELAKAVKDLILFYEKARCMKGINNPIAYALYHTWEKYDEKAHERKEKV